MDDGAHARGHVRRPAGFPAREQAWAALTMAPSDVGLFHALLESHGHLAWFTVLEPATALLRLFYLPDRERELRAALGLMREEIPMDIRWHAPYAGTVGSTPRGAGETGGDNQDRAERGRSI